MNIGKQGEVMTKEQALLQVAPIPSKNYDEIIKAKDDEIRRLNNLYADTIKDLGDALIEIERLKSDVYHMSYVIKEWQGDKARSIVAMLFWEWRKALREADESGASYEFSYGDYWYIEAKEKAFRQAHKMLKDNQ